MSEYSLITYPNPKVRQVARPVADYSTHDLGELVSRMEKTLRETKGLGLAAPQIGILQRVVVINTRDGMLTLVNPNITERSEGVELGEEGCLSVPRVYGLVVRALRIEVCARTVAGKLTAFRAEGLFARVIQHEADHLNGILFIDRVQKFTAGSGLLQEMWDKCNRDGGKRKASKVR